MGDKTLPPSQEKIRKARQKGDVGLSRDVVNLAKFAAISELAFATESIWRRQIAQMIAAAIGGIGETHQARLQVASKLAGQAGVVAVLLASVAAVVALAATLGQTRFNVASKAFASGMDKINPGNNLKQIISGQKLLMLVIGPLKVSVVLAVCHGYTMGRLPVVLQMYRMSLDQGWALTVDALRGFAHAVLIALAGLAAFDFALQRYMAWRKLRMDMEERKREYKEQEGDPHAKGHRRSLANEIRREAPPPPKDAPKTDAVVVNPQHIAIALAQGDTPGGLPRIVTKASGEAAFRLRHYAAREQIPIIRYVSLARLLFATGREGAHVPSNTVRAVALVYKAVADLRTGFFEAGDEFDVNPELAKAMLPFAGTLEA